MVVAWTIRVVCQLKLIGVFPKWSVTFIEFSEFRENDNHWSMNCTQFKDPVSHMCCAGAVVACWPLTQEVAGWQGFKSFYWMTYSANDIFSEFSDKKLQTIRENPIVMPSMVWIWNPKILISFSKSYFSFQFHSA